jgi:hypothetical protein
MYRSRFQKTDTLVSILFAAPAAFLLLWHLYSSSEQARLLLSCYVIVALPLYVLTGSYPPFASRWFWKAMLPVAAMVALGVYGQIELTSWFRYVEVKLPARMGFGFTATFATIEAWAACRIVDATEPKRSVDRF